MEQRIGKWNMLSRNEPFSQHWFAVAVLKKLEESSDRLADESLRPISYRIQWELIPWHRADLWPEDFGYFSSTMERESVETESKRRVGPFYENADANS